MKFSLRKWTRTELVVFGVLFGIGLADAVCRIMIMGWSRGLHYCLHDPGKTFFHIVILPIAAVLLVRQMPPSLFATYVRAWPLGLRRLVLPFVAVVFLAGMVGSFKNDRDWRCGSLGAYLLPMDIHQFDSDRARADAGEMDSLRALFYCQLIGVADCPQTAKTPAELKARYREITAHHQQNCANFPFGSFYNFVALLETLLAVATVAYVFLGILILAVHRRISEAPVSSTGLLTPVALICPWILMRVYSDLYINFIEEVTPAIYIMAVVLLLFVFLEYTLEVRPRQIERMQIVYGIVVGIAVLILGLVGGLEQSFQQALRLGPWLKALILLLIVSPFLVWIADQLFSASRSIKNERMEAR
jgi:hypothetical protein